MFEEFHRIQRLIDTHRLAEAEKATREWLTREPENFLGWTCLTRVLQSQKKLVQAEEAARKGISLEPESDTSWFLLAVVLSARNRHREALEAAQKAVALDPEDAANYGMVASQLMALGRHREAVDAARTGLAADADCDVCRHNLSLALSALGETGAAEIETRTLLEQDPEDAYSHAARGHHLLLSGDPDRARIHFMEALRLKPDMDAARSGLASSLTNRSAFFRLMLRFSSRMGRWGWKGVIVLIAALLVMARATEWSKDIPGLFHTCAALYAVSILLMGALTCSPELSSLLLLTDREARHVVTRDERRAALLSLLFILVSAILYGLWLWVAVRTASFSRGPMDAWLALMPIPMIRETFEAENSWVRRRMGIVASVVAAMTLCLISAKTVHGVRFTKEVLTLVTVSARNQKDVKMTETEKAEFKAKMDVLMKPHLARGRWLSRLDLLILLAGMFADNLRRALERRAPDPD